MLDKILGLFGKFGHGTTPRWDSGEIVDAKLYRAFYQGGVLVSQSDDTTTIRVYLNGNRASVDCGHFEVPQTKTLRLSPDGDYRDAVKDMYFHLAPFGRQYDIRKLLSGGRDEVRISIKY